MIINKYNIEKWMFDYFEGNLTQHEQIEFERFMQNNAQFEEEFNFWKESYQTNVEVPVYEAPKSLYKETFWTTQKVASFVFLGLILLSTGYLMYRWNDETKLEAVLTQNENLASLEQDLGLNKSKSAGVILNGTNEIVEKNSLGQKVDEDLNGTQRKGFSNYYKGAKYKQANKKGLVSKRNSTSLLYIKNRVKNSSRIQSQRLEDDYSELKSKGFSTGRSTHSKNARKLNYKMENKRIIDYTYVPRKEHEQYEFLDFNRANRKRKLKSKQNKEKQHERDKMYLENIAIISTLFYKDKSKLKQKKRSKMFDKFKNKEIALTNAHDPIFVKNNANPVENNVALTGGLNVTRIKTNISNRWNSSVNSRNKLFLSGDTYIEKLNAGVGITANINEFSKQKFTQSSFGVTYSQRIQLKEESSVSLGVNYKYTLNQYNPILVGEAQPIEITQNDMFVLSNSGESNSFNNKHLLSSALWYDGKFLYGGINLDNLNYLKNKNNNANEFVEYINPFKFAIQLGTDYRRNIYSAWVISPQVNYRYQQNASELWLGGVLKYKRLIAGLGGSFSDAYKVNLGVQGDNLRLIYGFDYSKTKLENQFYGTHEVSLRYILRGKNNWKK